MVIYIPFPSLCLFGLLRLKDLSYMFAVLFGDKVGFFSRCCAVYDEQTKPEVKKGPWWANKVIKNTKNTMVCK
jgi:hypothetical protein